VGRSAGKRGGGKLGGAAGKQREKISRWALGESGFAGLGLG
jgi:hypothetical protein